MSLICDDRAMIGCILHWYTSALYAVPVFGIMGWLKYVGWRDKRRADGGPPDGGGSASAAGALPGA